MIKRGYQVLSSDSEEEDVPLMLRKKFQASKRHRIDYVMALEEFRKVKARERLLAEQSEEISMLKDSASSSNVNED